VGRPGQAFFNSRIEQVSRDGLAAIAAITEGDARGCFSMGDEQLITEYLELRTGSVKDPAGYLNACRAMMRLADEAMVEELGAIDCRTLVVAGELDPYCPPKASRMIADAIPGSELSVIPGAGHCMHWEARDITNELILEFIERTGNQHE